MSFLLLQSFSPQFFAFALAELAADAAQLFLLRWRQSPHLFHHRLGMGRHHFCNQLLTARREPDCRHPTVFLLSFAPPPSVFFEVVHNQRDVSAAAEQLFAKSFLAHCPEVKKRFHHTKLTHRQPLRFELSREPRRKGVRRAHEIDVRVQCGDGLLASFEVGRHIRLNLNDLSSNHRMLFLSQGFKASKWQKINGLRGGGLWFLRRTQEYLANKALRSLGNDHFHCMCYVLRLQHLARIFSGVRRK